MKAPIPDALLLPLIETAGDTLRAMDATDVPGALRHLQSFDRRGFLHGPAPRQVRATLERDEAFREAVITRFVDRPEVRALLDTWDVAQVFERVDEAARAGDLALLASALWAARPDGTEFGLGVVHATYAQQQMEATQRDDVQAAARAHAEGEEARRRADAARIAAETALARVETELREERKTRRAREDDASAQVAAARRSAEDARARLEEAQHALREADVRAERATRRTKELEVDVALARAQLEEARAASRVPADTTRDIARAAEQARRLAGALDAVVARGVAAAPAPEAKPRGGGAKAPRAPAKRTQPEVPPGVVADSAKGADAMLRTDGVALFVDGYNVAKRAWPDATLAEQRERLAMALAALHARTGCSSTVVFDGEGPMGAPVLRRRGLRVLFSTAGEEADDVVVREVTALPKRVPVVVASSDAWVREHSEAQGAVVISAETLLAVAK